MDSRIKELNDGVMGRFDLVYNPVNSGSAARGHLTGSDWSDPVNGNTKTEVTMEAKKDLGIGDLIWSCLVGLLL